MLEISKLALPDVLELKPRKFGDDRGFFSETFHRQRLADQAGSVIVQISEGTSHAVDAVKMFARQDVGH